MGDTKEPLSFGPSERYLPALQEGDALTFELNSSGKDVDTEWGSKIQFSITVLTVKSSLDIKPGKYIWNTSCSAAKELYKYLNDSRRGLSPAEHSDEALLSWRLDLIRNEHGYTIKEHF